MLKEEVKAYEGYYSQVLHTGSRVICDPAPKDTDDDYLFLTFEGAVDAFLEKLQKEKWVRGGSVHDGGNRKSLIIQDWSQGFEGIDYGRVFRSYKKDDLNFIITLDPVYFKKFSLATGLAKKLNLLEKSERVDLFETIVRDVQHPLELNERRWWQNVFVGRDIQQALAAQDRVVLLDEVEPIVPAGIAPPPDFWEVGQHRG